jgi:hypothetical protein
MSATKFHGIFRKCRQKDSATYSKVHEIVNGGISRSALKYIRRHFLKKYRQRPISTGSNTTLFFLPPKTIAGTFGRINAGNLDT